MAVVTFEYDSEARKEAAQGGGKPLPEGRYQLRVESFEWKAPATPGKAPALVLKCKVLSSFNNENLGKTITRRFWVTPKAIPYGLIPFLQAAGIHFNDTGRGVEFDQDHLLGAATVVQCTHDKGETRVFEQWSWDEPVSAVTAQQAPMTLAQGNPALIYTAAPGAAPQMNPQWAPPQQQWAPPQQQAPFVPQAGPPQGYPQQAPMGPPQNGGSPPWLQGGSQVPAQPAPNMAGQGNPPPPRGFGQG